jgi:hypothetical protein
MGISKELIITFASITLMISISSKNTLNLRTCQQLGSFNIKISCFPKMQENSLTNKFSILTTTKVKNPLFSESCLESLVIGPF